MHIMNLKGLASVRIQKDFVVWDSVGHTVSSTPSLFINFYETGSTNTHNFCFNVQKPKKGTFIMDDNSTILNCKQKSIRVKTLTPLTEPRALYPIVINGFSSINAFFRSKKFSKYAEKAWGKPFLFINTGQKRYH